MAEQKGVSIQKLCSAVGISDAGFYKMINNDTMKISTLEDIARVLKVSPAYFLDDESGYNPGDYKVNNDDYVTAKDVHELIDILKDALVTKSDLIDRLRNDLKRLEKELKKIKNSQANVD